jgi:putative ABC transport system permease protein
MSATARGIGQPRAADVWGLAFSAMRQQKVRTLLTLIGVVVGTFTLVLSLAVGQGVDRAIVALFHEDDQLRKISVHPKFEPDAADVPLAEREPQGAMSDAKRQRIRRAMIRDWHSRSGRTRENRLNAAAIRRLESLDHVVRAEPIVQIEARADLGANRRDVGAVSVPMGSRSFANRLLAGRLFTPEDGRAAIVHEYLLYRWGLVDDDAPAAAIGRRFRLEFRSSPEGTLDLTGMLGRIGPDGAGKGPALVSGLRRLAALARFLPMPRDERDALHMLFDRISATSATRPEQVFEESFTIIGVVREREEKDPMPSLFGEWQAQYRGVLLPARAAAEL